MVTIYVASEISRAQAIFNSSLSQDQHKLIVIFFAAGDHYQFALQWNVSL